jgi:predicted secreted hydrolase
MIDRMQRPRPQRSAMRSVLVGLTLILPLLWGIGRPLPASGSEAGFQVLSGFCGLKFPDDHGAHPGYRNEWWYYTGNLKAEDGRRFGVQLTIFRAQISPPQAVRSWPRPASRWRTQQLFVGHAAVSLLEKRQHLQDQTIARGALNLAGAQQNTAGETHVFIDDWSIVIGPQSQRIQAKAKDFAFDLNLVPQKPPVLHGDQGYSRKGSDPQSASCYYSFTRLLAQGNLTVEGTSLAVEGLSWMDHEFSSAALEEDIAGWDWFSLQLSDQTELMIYLLRKKDGSYHPSSGGTRVDASGQAQALKRDDVRVEILDHWKSPASGAVYPSAWKIGVPRLALELDITPNLAAQEMRTAQSTGINYWEGSVQAKGRSERGALSASGYVELTGYDPAAGRY